MTRLDALIPRLPSEFALGAQSLVFERSICSGCGACLVTCPNSALSRFKGGVFIDTIRCTLCLECVEICPRDALVPTDRPARLHD